MSSPSPPRPLVRFLVSASITPALPTALLMEAPLPPRSVWSSASSVGFASCFRRWGHAGFRPESLVVLRSSWEAQVTGQRPAAETRGETQSELEAPKGRVEDRGGAGVENEMCLFGLQSVPAHPQRKTTTSASPTWTKSQERHHTPDDLGQESPKQPPSAPPLRCPHRSEAGCLHPPASAWRHRRWAPEENRAGTQQAGCWPRTQCRGSFDNIINFSPPARAMLREVLQEARIHRGARSARWA